MKNRKNFKGWLLRIHVAGQVANPVTVLADLSRIYNKNLKGHFDLQMTDLLGNQQLESIKKNPDAVTAEPRTPIKNIINHLSDEECALVGLDLDVVMSNKAMKRVLLFTGTSPNISINSSDDSLESGNSSYKSLSQKQHDLMDWIKSHSDKQENSEREKPIVYGMLTFNPETYQFFIGEKEINLTRTESLIIEILMKNAGSVVKHTNISKAVWGMDFPKARLSLKAYICRLREKIEADPKNPRIICTKPGIGYFMAKPAPDAEKSLITVPDTVVVEP